MENKHPDPLPSDHSIAPIGVRLDPKKIHPQNTGDYLEKHISQLAATPSIGNIEKILKFLDNPNLDIRKLLCKQITDLSQTVSEPKEQALLKEGLAVLQKDKHPIIRLYLAQLTKKKGSETP